MSLVVVQYQTMDELRCAHPEIKSFSMVHQTSTQETVETQLTTLRGKHIEGRVYQVGNYFWKEAHHSRQETIRTP